MSEAVLALPITVILTIGPSQFESYYSSVHRSSGYCQVCSGMTSQRGSPFLIALDIARYLVWIILVVYSQVLTCMQRHEK